MAPKATSPTSRYPPLPDELVNTLERKGIGTRDEMGLRREPQRHLPAYTLYHLLSAARRHWKCHYRIMFRDPCLDCQMGGEAYARALLAALDEGKGDS